MTKCPAGSIALAVLALLCSLPVQGQVGTPSLGAIFDPQTSELRSVLGIPGLARIGAPLDLGMRITSAAYSPDRDYALAAPAESNAILIVDGNGARTIPALDAFGRVTLSPSGEYAALVDATGRRLVVVSGLPASPEFVVRIWFPTYHGTPACGRAAG